MFVICKIDKNKNKLYLMSFSQQMPVCSFDYKMAKIYSIKWAKRVLNKIEDDSGVYFITDYESIFIHEEVHKIKNSLLELIDAVEILEAKVR